MIWNKMLWSHTLKFTQKLFKYKTDFSIKNKLYLFKIFEIYEINLLIQYNYDRSELLTHGRGRPNRMLASWACDSSLGLSPMCSFCTVRLPPSKLPYSPSPKGVWWKELRLDSAMIILDINKFGLLFHLNWYFINNCEFFLQNIIHRRLLTLAM